MREADGCLDVKMLRAVDRQGVFLLLVKWESVEYHTQVFVKSEASKFFESLSPLFTAPPDAFHAVPAIGAL